METFASHPRASQWSDKNILKPKDVPLYYYKKFWFNCDICLHEFETNLNSIARLNTWCPYCANKKLCVNKECKKCFDKSFASSDKVTYLTKENTIISRNVFKSCSERAIFNCQQNHPDFEATLNNISRGKWCKLCGYKSSKEKQSISFDDFIKKANEKYGKTYDYSKVIINGVDRPVIIICKIHGEFNQSPWNHYTSKLGGCPECTKIKRGESNRYTFAEFIEMANTIHGSKFGYSKANNIYKTLKIKIPIICKIHGEFIQAPSLHLKGVGCPYCKNKTEGKLKEFLQKYYTELIPQFKFDNCKKKFRLPFDFFIPSIKTIIELDGIQHFKKVSNWRPPDIKRDIYKMQKAEAEGYKIIRIFQEDVYNASEKWLDENLLPEIQSEERTPVFISSIDGLYDEHIALYEKGEEIVLDSDDDSDEEVNEIVEN